MLDNYSLFCIHVYEHDEDDTCLNEYEIDILYNLAQYNKKDDLNHVVRDGQKNLGEDRTAKLIYYSKKRTQ